MMKILKQATKVIFFLAFAFGFVTAMNTFPSKVTIPYALYFVAVGIILGISEKRRSKTLENVALVMMVPWLVMAFVGSVYAVYSNFGWVTGALYVLIYVLVLISYFRVVSEDVIKIGVVEVDKSVRAEKVTLSKILDRYLVDKYEAWPIPENEVNKEIPLFLRDRFILYRKGDQKIIGWAGFYEVGDGLYLMMTENALKKGDADLYMSKIN